MVQPGRTARVGTYGNRARTWTCRLVGAIRIRSSVEAGRMHHGRWGVCCSLQAVGLSSLRRSACESRMRDIWTAPGGHQNAGMRTARGTECVECRHARSSGTDGAVIEACWGRHGARGDRAWPSEGVPGSWRDGRGHGGGGAHRSCRGGRGPSGRASACCVLCKCGGCVDVCEW